MVDFSWSIDSANDLFSRTKLPRSFRSEAFLLLILITALVGGVVAGLAALSGTTFGMQQKKIASNFVVKCSSKHKQIISRCTATGIFA